jgi:hypothetical protein
MRRKTDNRSLTCTKAVEDADWRAFVREKDEPRFKRHNAEKRWAIVQVSARAADPDGSNVCLASTTIAKRTGIVRTTAKKYIAELVEMDMMAEGGYRWIYGKQVRERSLKVANIRKRAGLPPLEVNHEKPPCGQSCGEPLEVKDAEVPCGQTCMPTQPPSSPVSYTPSPSTAPRSKTERAVDGWEEDFFLAARVWERLDAMPKKVRDRLMEETEKRGFAKVKCAVDFFLRESFDKANAPWFVFLSKIDSLMPKAEAWAKEDPSGFRRKYVLTPDEVKRLDEEAIERQRQELVRQMESKPEERVGEVDPADIFG